MRILTTVVLGAVILTTAGCSNLKGQRVIDGPKDRERTMGISYYLAKPKFSIVRRAQRDNKAAIPRYDLVVGWEPDPDRRFEVGMRAGIFTSDKFELNLAPDGTTTGLTSSRTDELGKALAGAAKLAGEVAKAFASQAPKAALARMMMLPPIPAPGLPIECAAWCNISDDKKCAEQTKTTMANLFQLVVADDCDDAVSAVDQAASIDAETKVLEGAKCLAALKKPKEDDVSDVLAALNDELDKAITEAIKKTSTQTLAKVARLRRKLSDALNLLDDRALRDRMRTLLAVLKREPGIERAKGYVKLSAEFDRIATQVASLNPGAPSPPMFDGVDVTSQIDRDVYVDRRCDSITSTEAAHRVQLAQARILAGVAKAVVITAPQHSTSRGEK